MNSKQIECILEVSRTLNFNKAAENLFITQPTLTYHIKAAEEEIQFTLFQRSGRGTSLTPAGKQFCEALRGIHEDMKQAIEQGQNLSSHYEANLTIGLPMRSAIYFLPRAIEKFESAHAGVSITPEFTPLHDYDRFLRGEEDMVFAREEDMEHVPEVKIHKLFQSRIYLVTGKDDPLAGRELVTMDDLAGRRLMVGGGSQPELRAVQSRVLSYLHLEHFNSSDHATTLTNIAAHKGVCLVPGFLNDHTEEFSWIPFDCDERVSCVICTHGSDNRGILKDFLAILRELYETQPEFL